MAKKQPGFTSARQLGVRKIALAMAVRCRNNTQLVLHSNDNFRLDHGGSDADCGTPRFRERTITSTQNTIHFSSYYSYATTKGPVSATNLHQMQQPTVSSFVRQARHLKREGWKEEIEKLRLRVDPDSA